MSKPLYRSNPDTQLAAARRDIEMLKRRPFGLGGIRFNVLNDSGTGGFLDVTTHDYTRFVNDGNLGTQITDTGTSGVEVNASDHITLINTGGASTGISIEQSGGSAGIAISDSSSTGIYLTATNQMQLVSLGGLLLNDNSGGIQIQATDTPSDFSPVTSNAIALLAGSHTHQGSIELATYDANLHPDYLWLGTVAFVGSGLTFHGVTVQIQHSTQTFAVVDSGGFPIFRVDEGGSVHIRSGHSVVADL